MLSSSSLLRGGDTSFIETYNSNIKIIMYLWHIIVGWLSEKSVTKRTKALKLYMSFI